MLIGKAGVQARAPGRRCGLLLPAFRPAPAQRHMTRPGILFRNAFLLALLAIFLASGCSRLRGDRDDPNEGVPVEELYERGHQSMRNGNWSRAAVTFRRLVAQYPYGPYTEQALIETAYAQYKMGQHDEAISSIDRFLRTYPTHRNSAYMYYLRGLVNASRDTVFLQRVWSLDPSSRDLTTPNQAYADFAVVTERFANTRYAEDARERMIALRDMFARHDLDRALYYLRRGANVASVNRATYLLEDYPQTAQQDDAVAVLAEAYTRLGNDEVAAEARRVRELNDPAHPWLSGNYPQTAHQDDAVAVLVEAYTRLGNDELAADARRVLELNDPAHPWLSGDWPKYPWAIRKLNPFAGERSPIDAN